MLKHYYNKINNSVRVLQTFDEDFNLYMIIRADKSAPFDLITSLSDYSSELISVCYDINATYFITNSRSKLNETVLSNLFSKSVVKSCDKINSRMVDKGVILNLLLNLYAAKRFNCSGSEINGSYHQIVKKSGSNMQIAITCRFNQRGNNIDLSANVKTFSKFEKLTEKDKGKCKRFFVISNGTMIRKPSDCSIDDSIFVIKQLSRTDKSRYNAFELTHPTGNSKVDIIGDIYEYFKGCKYVHNFEFESMDMNSYGDKKYFDCLQKTYKDFYENRTLNVVCPDNFDFSVFGQKQFEFINSIHRVSAPVDGVNLVLMRFVKKGENVDADKQYVENVLGDHVCQHINIDQLEDLKSRDEVADAIRTSLREIIIKHEVKAGKIDSFDWSVFNGVEFNTLTFVKQDEDERDKYHIIVVNIHTGEIGVRSEARPKFLDEIGPELDPSDIGTIISDHGHAITLRKTDYHIVPYYDEYREEVERIIDGLHLSVSGSEIYEKLLQIKTDENRLTNVIDAVLASSKSSNIIYRGSENAMLLLDLKKIINGVKMANTSVVINRIDEWIREEFDAAIVNHLKGMRKTIFPGLIGLHYNDNYFSVAERADSVKNQARNIGLNEIIYHDDTDPIFFQSLLPLFYVPFVRNNMLSSKPFPFKYLDEWIRKEKLCDNINAEAEK